MTSEDAPAPGVAFVVAGALDQRTGGYLYDARIVAGLRDRGRDVRVIEVPGNWPEPSTADIQSLREELATLPDGTPVVVDGLVGGAAPAPIEEASARLRIVALVHHPLADEGDRSPEDVARLELRERRTLRTARGVVVTSAFTRDRVVELGAEPGAVVVVEPGTDRPPSVQASSTESGPLPLEGATSKSGSEVSEPVTLLCLGSVVPRKDQAGLVDALIALHDARPDLSWRCEVVGSLQRDRSYAGRVREAVGASPIADRVRFTGEVGEPDLEMVWAEADVLVSASRYEGYGMALTEAMMRGLPVVAVTGGAVERTVPPDVGCLVTPADGSALQRALERVVEDEAYRTHLAERSREHADSLPTWSAQATAFDTALREMIGA